jgi:hypothetical protein
MFRTARTTATLLALLAACSNGTEVSPSAPRDAATSVQSAPIADSVGDSETPATGSAALVAAWIARGDYRRWTCEPVGHDARFPSPHGRNRICNNRKVVEHGAGEYPTGAASVKEVFDDLGKLTGHLISAKLGPGRASAWMWYMEVDNVVVLNGRGDTPAPATKCVACHEGAGSDAEHSGHDFVYTQLKPE